MVFNQQNISFNKNELSAYFVVPRTRLIAFCSVCLILVIMVICYPLFLDNVINYSFLSLDEKNRFPDEHDTLFDYKEAYPNRIDKMELILKQQQAELIFAENPKKRILAIMGGLDHFSTQFCDNTDNATHPATVVAQNWKFNEEEFWHWLRPADLPRGKLKIDDQTKADDSRICAAMREKLVIFDEPLSEEEYNYPIAYGMLVYKDSPQVYLSLSAFYHPQNVYCIAVDSKGERQFKMDIEVLGRCLPNVFVLELSEIVYMDVGILDGVFKCLRYLSDLKYDWKYYQYLSGVDLPLKTNLEMVRIFKKLNNTVNAEITRPGGDQIKKNNLTVMPLPLWKSSVSVLIPRPAADALVLSPVTQHVYSYLRPNRSPEELFWLTIFGNHKLLPIPGGFDAQPLFNQLKMEREEMGKRGLSDYDQSKQLKTIEEPFPPSSYYISRYQVWGDIKGQCLSKKSSGGSCVYGLADLKLLLQRPELVAHKLYLNFEPAAFFCLYKEVRLRALDKESQQKFQGAVYEQIPFVELAAGMPLSEVKFFFA